MSNTFELALSDPSFKFNEYKEHEFHNILNSAHELCEYVNSFLPVQLTSGWRNNENNEQAGDDENELYGSKQMKTFGKAARAKTIEELHKRIETLKGKKTTYKEKLLKKGLKNRLKKKQKLEERKQLKNVARKQEKSESKEEKEEEKGPEEPKGEKPNVPLKTELQFNKIIVSSSELEKKRQLDPKRTLQKLEKANKKLQKLKMKGKKDKLLEIKDKQVWDAAIQKAEGVKVKDDVELLKKSISKIKQRKVKSKKKWEERENSVKLKKEEAQKKRQENINKKKQERTKKRKKVLVKKGRILPR